MEENEIVVEETNEELEVQTTFIEDGIIENQEEVIENANEN